MNLLLAPKRKGSKQYLLVVERKRLFDKASDSFGPRWEACLFSTPAIQPIELVALHADVDSLAIHARPSL